MSENEWTKSRIPPNFVKEQVSNRCIKLSRLSLLKLVQEVNGWPIEDDEKLTAVLTICQEMLSGCLDGIYKDRLPIDEKLAKKLEFLRIMRSHWIRQSADEQRAKEKSK